MAAQERRAYEDLNSGWLVVAFNGKDHEVYENGTVVHEADRIIHAGGAYMPARRHRIDAMRN
jgi:hypothetical protein